MSDIFESVLVRIIDDEASVRTSLRFIFSIIGLHSACYESAEEFLEKDDPSLPGCIVLDMNMGKMSGLMLQQELQRRQIDLPVVFLTGHGTVNSAVLALKHGAYDFLEKPVNPEKLQSIVRDMIESNLSERRLNAEKKILQQRYAELTEREKEVIALVARGISNKEIAATLGIAEQTTKIHRGNALYKLQIRTAVDAFQVLQKLGLSIHNKTPDIQSEEARDA